MYAVCKYTLEEGKMEKEMKECNSWDCAIVHEVGSNVKVLKSKLWRLISFSPHVMGKYQDPTKIFFSLSCNGMMTMTRYNLGLTRNGISIYNCTCNVKSETYVITNNSKRLENICKTCFSQCSAVVGLRWMAYDIPYSSRIGRTCEIEPNVIFQDDFYINCIYVRNSGWKLIYLISSNVSYKHFIRK